MERAARDRGVDPLDEVAVLGVRRRFVAAFDRDSKTLRQRLDRGAVAQVLEPLLGSGPDALLLLFDVRHGVKTPATAGSKMLARAWPSRRVSCAAVDVEPTAPP